MSLNNRKNKLTFQDQLKIRSYQHKLSAYKIAAMFNISHTTVYKIWKTPLLSKSILPITHPAYNLIQPHVPSSPNLDFFLEQTDQENLIQVNVFLIFNDNYTLIRKMKLSQEFLNDNVSCPSRIRGKIHQLLGDLFQTAASSRSMAEVVNESEHDSR